VAGAARAVAVPSPLGTIAAAVDETGLRALRFEEQRAEEAPVWLADGLAAYFAGELEALGRLPLSAALRRNRVHEELRRVPPGATITYTELARRAGYGNARAAGAACAHNPVSLVIPCHRAVGADGSLRGYGGGLDRKAWLLQHEGAR
jgi:methylated-DNA-[protein]-cysteine S-methyltransferase